MTRILTTALAIVTLLEVLTGPVAAQPEPGRSPAPSQASLADRPADGPGEVETPANVDPPAEMAFDDPAWRRVRPGRGPAAREDHTWTVDADRRFAWLFGGRDGGRVFGDLWRFDLATDDWRRIKPRNRGPEARFGHSAAWVDGQGLVVFAGQRGSDFFGDLWAFDAGARRWTRLPARGGSPSARYGSCAVVGPARRLLISHGFTFAGRLDDTRAYDFGSRRWTRVGPVGRRPGQRCLHDCFTSADGHLVLYGGQDDSAGALGDLWTVRGDGTWRRVADPAPPPRRLYAVTEAGADAWVFGGADEDDDPLADLWRVDRETLTFERVEVRGAGPSARYAGTLVTDAERGRLLLFGGQGTRARDDVWQLIDLAGARADDPARQPAASPAVASPPSPEPTEGPDQGT